MAADANNHQDHSEGIGLGELILKTAREIRYARDKAKEARDPVLKLEHCELELKVTLKAEADAGIKVWLLDLSAKGSGEHASTIKLKFDPASQDEVFETRHGVEKSVSEDLSDPVRRTAGRED